MASRSKSPGREAAARLIGGRIRDARISRGLSQKQLGCALGVSHQAVNKYELAEVDLSVRRLLALAEALGVSAAFLIGESRAPRRKAPQALGEGRQPPRRPKHSTVQDGPDGSLPLPPS